MASETAEVGALHGADPQRVARYQQVVREVRAREDFLLEDVKRACPDQTPKFVTKVVRELATDGLLSEAESGRREYRWLADREQFSEEEWIASKLSHTVMTLSPAQDRPRERLLAQGTMQLRTAELLAILIRSGRTGESALQAGEKLATAFASDITHLIHARRGELKSISAAVGDTAYCQIMAGIELGRRIEQALARKQPPKRINGSDDAREFCAERFARLAADANHEELHVVLLNTKNQPITTHLVSVGSLDASLAHPREIFRPAIKEAAKSIILVHNHPSGDPTPGEEDVRVTQRLMEVAKVVGIELLDHIVVARSGTASVRETMLSR